MIQKGVVIFLSIFCSFLIFAISVGLCQLYWIRLKTKRYSSGSYGCPTLFGIYLGVLLATALSVAIYFGVYPQDFNCAAAILISVILAIETFFVAGCVACIDLKDGAFEKGGCCSFFLICCLLPGGIAAIVVIVSLGTGLGYHYC
jgi:hypothetical protein